MKKRTLGFLMFGLLAIFLAGCGADKPDVVVDNFLSSVKEGDFDKSGSFVTEDSKPFKFDELNEDMEGMDSEEFLKALSSKYDYETPEEVSSEGDTAKVRAEITSVDFAEAFTATMEDVIAEAMTMAESDMDSAEAEAEFEKMMWDTLNEKLNDEDAKTATRDITFNLEKNEDGEYKIIADENFQEAMIANIDSLEETFSE